MRPRDLHLGLAPFFCTNLAGEVVEGSPNLQEIVDLATWPWARPRASLPSS